MWQQRDMGYYLGRYREVYTGEWWCLGVQHRWVVQGMLVWWCYRECYRWVELHGVSQVGGIWSVTGGWWYTKGSLHRCVKANVGILRRLVFDTGPIHLDRFPAPRPTERTIPVFLYNLCQVFFFLTAKHSS